MFDIDDFYSSVNFRGVNLKKDISLLLSSDIDFLSIDKQLHASLHKLYSNEDVRDFITSKNVLVNSYLYYFENYSREMLIARKYNLNFYRRTSRLRKRIDFMLSNFDCLFLTITFNNYFLNSTTLKTRRTYVTRFLNSLNCYAVGNIDFGNGNKYIDYSGYERVGTFREHYHCIVATDFVDNTNNRLWSYGGVNIERIVTDDNNTSRRTSKYITKLTSHCVKKSTDSVNNSLIYIKPKRK